MPGFRQGHDRIVARHPGAVPKLAGIAMALTSDSTGPSSIQLLVPGLSPSPLGEKLSAGFFRATTPDLDLSGGFSRKRRAGDHSRQGVEAGGQEPCGQHREQ
jgi:hypothetical protein